MANRLLERGLHQVFGHRSVGNGGRLSSDYLSHGGKFYLQDNRETPDTLIVTYEYPGFVCTYENRECNGNAINGKGYGITFHGTDGTLFVDRGGFELMPEKRRESQNRVVDRAQPMKAETRTTSTRLTFATSSIR